MSDEKRKSARRIKLKAAKQCRRMKRREKSKMKNIEKMFLESEISKLNLESRQMEFNRYKPKTVESSEATEDVFNKERQLRVGFDKSLWKDR
jgi:hypothetical protein